MKRDHDDDGSAGNNVVRGQFGKSKSWRSRLRPKANKAQKIRSGKAEDDSVPLWPVCLVIALAAGFAVAEDGSLRRYLPFPTMAAKVDERESPSKPLPHETVPTANGSTEVRATFGFCHTGGGYNCVVDGDTIWLQGQDIRIADIDAPETHEWRCPSEKALGDRATQRLLQLVNNGTVSLEPIDRDEDKYGRKLRIVLVDGKSVGETLVEEGLARWYAGGRKPWC